MTRLTTTSYLILGMLASQDWSAYELAEQVHKGLTEIWPRAQRQLYNAPKQLVEQGLATATKQATGRRERTVYSITPAGREALRRWLASDASQVSLEFEAMVHVLFADHGSVDDLRRTLVRVREQALAERAQFEAHAAIIGDVGHSSFPEKGHLFALSSAFMIGHFSHLAEWATWALGEVDTWQDTAPPSELRPDQR